MTIQTLPDLIDKQDNFEIVRDQIAGILLSETQSQQSLAVTAGEDPEFWKFDVYTERTNPWSKWLSNPSTPSETSPIVNVWVDTSQFPKNRGSVVGKSQGHDVTYNIDCYAYGSSGDDGSGHVAGDEKAGLESARIIRLVRNILIAGINSYLQLRPVVSERWIQNLTFFQAAQDTQSVQNIRAARLTMVVTMTENSPQVTGEVIESIFNEVKRTSDGKVYFDTEIDVT